MVPSRVSGAALLFLCLLPAGVAGQAGAAAGQAGTADEAAGQAGETGEAGWIGIEVEGRALADGSVRVMIVRVENGSPAQRAGVRPFDLLLRLDGEEVSPEILVELGGRLRPGLPLQLTLQRGDRQRTVGVVAGRRPDPMDPATMEEFGARVDSARLQILRMVDSLMADTTWATLRTAMEAARRVLLEEAGARGDMEAAAEVMARARGMMERTRDAMRSQRFGVRPPAGPPPARLRITVGDPGFDERRGPGGRPGRGRIRGGGGIGDRGGPGGPPPGVRFRSPYLLGDRFVAGAELEVVELDAPAGAADTRLRVVRVVEGSPADRAGLAPGDLIVTIGGAPVGNLREFRIRLGRVILQGRPEMRIVRGDTTLVVALPRP